MSDEEIKDLSLREEIANAMEEVKTKDEPVKEVLPPETKIGEVKNEEANETEEKRSRDETGKFAKKDTKQKEVIKENIGEVRSEQKTEIKAPNSWSANAKTKWAEIPAELQAEINKRETEIHQGFTRMDEDRQFGKVLKDVVQPYMPIIQAEGGTPATAIQALLNSAYVLRTGTPQAKTQLFQQLAQQYGVDLAQISQGQVKTDPQLQAIQSELVQLKNDRQQEITVREQQQREALQSQIDAFAADPAHNHFEVVRPHMVALLKGGLAKDLQDAYDQAVYARPDIRSTLLQSQSAELEANRIADAKAKADKARKASVSVRGGPGATAPTNSAVSNRSLREELEANFRELAS